MQIYQTYKCLYCYSTTINILSNIIKSTPDQMLHLQKGLIKLFIDISIRMILLTMFKFCDDNNQRKEHVQK